MRGQRVLASAIMLTILLCSSAKSTPIEAYGHLPNLEHVTISPDGSAYAYVRAAGAKRIVAIQSLLTGKLLGGVDIGDTKLRDLTWADNKHLLLTTSTTTHAAGPIGPRQEWWAAQFFNLDSGKTTALLQKSDSLVPMMNIVGGLPRIRVIDGKTVVFVDGIYFPVPGGYGKRALFEVDFDSVVARMVKGSSSLYTDWVVDANGAIVAQSDYDDDSRHWTLQSNVNGSWTAVLDVLAPVDPPYVDGLMEDGSAVVVSIPNNGQTEYKRISLKDGSAASLTKPEFDAGWPILDRLSSRIIGGVHYTDKTDYAFGSSRAETVWKSIAAAYPDTTDVELISWTDDWNKIVLKVSGPEYGDAYHLVDMTTHKSDMIGREYDDIGPDDYAPVKWITYSAGDGRSISAYLTLPINHAAKNLPLIVLPHGGPFERNGPGFYWLPQGLASRGYAVLEPQFRGSDGFGWDLLSAGFGQMGRKMQTDLSDGVRALAAQGIVDPKRVCIVGRGYGGYAALAGATLDKGVYRCAVSDAGESNLHDFLRYLQSAGVNPDIVDVRRWERYLGTSDPDDASLDAISPIKHVDQIDIPILLIHGRDDTVVPIAQSENMADELRKAGKPVDFVEFDNEDHWLSRSEMRLQMLNATVKFLEANNPPN